MKVAGISPLKIMVAILRAINVHKETCCISFYDTSDTYRIHQLQYIQKTFMCQKSIFNFQVWEVSLPFITCNPSVGSTWNIFNLASEYDMGSSYSPVPASFFVVVSFKSPFTCLVSKCYTSWFLFYFFCY